MKTKKDSLTISPLAFFILGNVIVGFIIKNAVSTNNKIPEYPNNHMGLEENRGEALHIAMIGCFVFSALYAIGYACYSSTKNTVEPKQNDNQRSIFLSANKPEELITTHSRNRPH